MTIIGTGVDILEIERIERIVREKPRFIERFFTVEEQKFFNIRLMSVQTIAAGFAAKEAVVKAMGTGFRGFEMKDVEILRNTIGKPIVNLYGKAKDTALQLGIDDFQISLSHSDHYAIAFVIATGNQ